MVKRKQLSESQVDDLIRLKYGQYVTHPSHYSWVSNVVLGKIFGISAGSVRHQYMKRFEQLRVQGLPLLQQL